MSYDANAAYNSGAGDPGQGMPGAGAPGYGGPGYGGAPRGATSPDDLTLPLYGASFGQAIKRFFKNYVNFKGRASRSEFWFAYLFLILGGLIPYLLLIIGIVMMSVSASADPYNTSPSGGAMALVSIGGILFTVFVLGTILPLVSVAARRFHDAGFSALLLLLWLTGVGGAVILVLCLLPSKPEGQRYDA